MTNPKNPEAQSEELNLEQLKDAAGGIGGSAGPGGTSFPKSEIAVGPDSDFCPNSGSCLIEMRQIDEWVLFFSPTRSSS